MKQSGGIIIFDSSMLAGEVHEENVEIKAKYDLLVAYYVGEVHYHSQSVIFSKMNTDTAENWYN